MSTGTQRSVAVLLNRNAQRVVPELIAHVRRLVDPRSVFVTSSLDEARDAIAEIVRDGYQVVCTGGGDGTFISAVRFLDTLCEGAMPIMMGLRLGSGNAIAEVCGASSPSPRGVAADLSRAASDESARPLAMLRVDGQLTHSVGTGLDAKFNEDFRDLVKNWLGRGRLGRLFHGVPGFVIAGVARTIPRMIREPLIIIRVINHGPSARRLDATGVPTDEPHGAGATLYHGPAIIAAASTVATYGRRLRFFPFADRLSGHFSLRISDARARDILPNIPRVFAGTYRNPARLHDFAATDVSVEMATPSPWHVGGDLQTYTTRFRVALATRVVPLLFAP